MTDDEIDALSVQIVERLLVLGLARFRLDTAPVEKAISEIIRDAQR